MTWVGEGGRGRQGVIVIGGRYSVGLSVVCVFPRNISTLSPLSKYYLNKIFLIQFGSKRLSQVAGRFVEAGKSTFLLNFIKHKQTNSNREKYQETTQIVLKWEGGFLLFISIYLKSSIFMLRIIWDFINFSNNKEDVCSVNMSKLKNLLARKVYKLKKSFEKVGVIPVSIIFALLYFLPKLFFFT